MAPFHLLVLTLGYIAFFVNLFISTVRFYTLNRIGLFINHREKIRLQA